MKKQKFLLFTVLPIFSYRSFSQDFVITTPKLEFDGDQLSISYDLLTKNKSDIFYVWVEMKTKAGDSLWVYSYKGEVGDSIKPGMNKKIFWSPGEDAVFVDDDITIELKGERYIRSFNKGSAVFRSAIIPGLGQTKIYNSMPWWLLSIPAYGAVAGGLIVHKKYLDKYKAYKSSTDEVERGDLYDKAQKQQKLSGALFISAAAIWASNVIWIAAKPNRYKPLHHPGFSVSSVPYNQRRITMYSIKVDF
jgi:hypothetical protein